MAIVPGQLNRWLYTFATGTEELWAENQERANEILLERSVLTKTNSNCQVVGHVPGFSTHRTKGVLLSYTNQPSNNSGFYASTTGSSSNNGTAASPWDLQTALNGGNGLVQPGDTIWLRGGTYVANTFTSTLNGSANAPVVVKQYPGELGTITGNLFVVGNYSWFQGFEVGTAFAYTRANHVQVDSGIGNKLINLIIHDGTGNGIAANSSAIGGEYYGCIVYNNGSLANNDHGFYVHNFTGYPPLNVRDNIVFNNYAFNIQVYAETPGYLNNIFCDGNICFNANGITDLHGSDLLIDGISASNIGFTNNYTYELNSSAQAVFWAVNGGTDITVTGNVLMGGSNKGMYFGPGGFLGAGRASTWTNATVKNNVVYVAGGEVIMVPTTCSGWTWLSNQIYRDPTAVSWARNLVDTNFATWKTNTLLGTTDFTTAAAPTGVQVYTRANVYEQGRGHIIIYNWAGQSNVSVDLSTILNIGQAYNIFNSQNILGAAVVSGTYTGGTVSIPMAGISPPVPVARAGTSVAPTTGPTFQTFVVRLQGA